HIYGRAEMGLVGLADFAVNAIGGHDEIAVGEGGLVELGWLQVALKLHVDAQFAAAFLQQHQQRLPRTPGKAVPGTAEITPLKPDFHIIPVSKIAPDSLV